MSQIAQTDFKVLADDYAGLLHELLELLQLEQGALKSREFDNIVSCTEQKEILLSKLKQLDRQRLDMEESVEPSVALEMRNRFKQIVSSLLEKCNDINVVNGGIVEISRQFNQRMLNTILGTSVENNELYDAGGGNSGNKQTQVFAKI